MRPFSVTHSQDGTLQKWGSMRHLSMRMRNPHAARLSKRYILSDEGQLI